MLIRDSERRLWESDDKMFDLDCTYESVHWVLRKTHEDLLDLYAVVKDMPGVTGLPAFPVCTPHSFLDACLFFPHTTDAYTHVHTSFPSLPLLVAHEKPQTQNPSADCPRGGITAILCRLVAQNKFTIVTMAVAHACT
jgi:hypothetical protein